jgi:hypothetical protein
MIPAPSNPISVPAEPAIPPSPGTIEIVEHVPSVIAPGQMACRAMKPLPWAGVKEGQTFLVAEPYGRYLIDQKCVRQTYPDCWIGTLFESGVQVGSRTLTRDKPLLVSFEDAQAAVGRCDTPYRRQNGDPIPPLGAYSGAVRILSAAEAADWDPQTIPKDPRLSPFAGRPSLMDSPPVRVHALGNTSYSHWLFEEDMELSLPEAVAVMCSFPNPRRPERKGKALVSIVGELTPRGKAFQAAVAAHVKKHPDGWSREDEGWPTYYNYHSH